ncbi:MAG: prepilin-type N-terminal cleavage/methylation domain-containing protein [Sedimentisphaerales bacterium]|nr:prepilin-type N-terminal cleavage/methylation domain-containing protein [Sedimentisphaerales bacterium]
MRNERKGFTLIELLVVISIISLLLSILLPVLSRARLIAQKSLCLATTGKYAKAQQTYAADNKDYFSSTVAKTNPFGDTDTPMEPDTYIPYFSPYNACVFDYLDGYINPCDLLCPMTPRWHPYYELACKMKVEFNNPEDDPVNPRPNYWDRDALFGPYCLWNDYTAYRESNKPYKGPQRSFCRGNQLLISDVVIYDWWFSRLYGQSPVCKSSEPVNDWGKRQRHLNHGDCYYSEKVDSLDDVKDLKASPSTAYADGSAKKIDLKETISVQVFSESINSNQPNPATGFYFIPFP